MNNEDQIVKFQNNKKLLEINDHLFISNVEMAANLHAAYSKINLVAIDTSNGKKEKAIATTCNVDPIKLKLLWDKIKYKKHIPPSQSNNSTSNNQNELNIGYGQYKDLTPSQVLIQKKDEGINILNNLKETFQKNAEKYPINKTKINQIDIALKKYKEGSLNTNTNTKANAEILVNETFLYEQKALPGEKNQNNQGEQKCTILSIVYNPKMDSCWNITIENGWCKTQTQANGGSAIAKGSYRKDKEVKVVINDDRFKEMIRQTNDYILMKESIFMRILYPQVTKFKKAKIEQFKKTQQK